MRGSKVRCARATRHNVAFRSGRSGCGTGLPSRDALDRGESRRVTGLACRASLTGMATASKLPPVLAPRGHSAAAGP
jgi:hypothetical protein